MTNKEFEFMGYLKGEGCFRISKQHKKNHLRVNYRPQISVAQRADDTGILEWAKKRFGGYLVHQMGRLDIPNQNPSVTWVLTSIKTCYPVIRMFLESMLPSKKFKEVLLLKEFCDLKSKPKKKFPFKNGRFFWESDGDYKRQEWLFREISNLKKFKGV
jgi:hypothetical protein